MLAQLVIEAPIDSAKTPHVLLPKNAQAYLNYTNLKFIFLKKKLY